MLLGHGDAEPTQKYSRPGDCPLKASELATLDILFSRLLTRDQMLTLSEVKDDSDTITSLLTRMSETEGIPLPTLKSSARVLSRLDLISYGPSSSFMKVGITSSGKTILLLIGRNYD